MENNTKKEVMLNIELIKVSKMATNKRKQLVSSTIEFVCVKRKSFLFFRYSIFFIIILPSIITFQLWLYSLTSLNNSAVDRARNNKQAISIVAEASSILRTTPGLQSAQDLTLALELAEEAIQEPSNYAASSGRLNNGVGGFKKNNNNNIRSISKKSKFKADEEDLSQEQQVHREDKEKEDEKFRVENERKTLNEFLSNLPTISVAQKHSATIECDIDAKQHHDDNFSFKLVWVKLTRPTSDRIQPFNNNNNYSTVEMDDIKLISLNQKIITPDKRFKVTRQSELKWTLSIDNISSDENQAYFLCQVSLTSKNDGSRKKDAKNFASNSTLTKQFQNQSVGYAGGAKLNVLVPPRILEQENSLIQVNEFERFSLRCKAVSEPQAQLIWKREDGKSLDYYDNVEQIFKHEIERRRNSNQIVSIDSSELIFNSVERHQAGAYLCIASNGVQPGVSQRTSVEVINCRSSSSSPLNPQYEPCEQSFEQPSSTSSTTTQSPSTTEAANISTLHPSLPTDRRVQQQQRFKFQQQHQVNGAAVEIANNNNNNNIRRNWKITSQQINKQRLPSGAGTDKRRITASNDITNRELKQQASLGKPTSGAPSKSSKFQIPTPPSWPLILSSRFLFIPTAATIISVLLYSQQNYIITTTTTTNNIHYRRV